MPCLAARTQTCGVSLIAASCSHGRAMVNCLAQNPAVSFSLIVGSESNAVGVRLFTYWAMHAWYRSRS